MKKTDIAVISFTYRGAELAEHIQEVMDAVWKNGNDVYRIA